MTTKVTNTSKTESLKQFETNKLNHILRGAKLGSMSTDSDLE